MGSRISEQANDLLHLCEVNRRWWRVRFEALAMAVGIVAAVLFGMTMLDSGPFVAIDRIEVSGPPPTVGHDLVVDARKGVFATWGTQVIPAEGSFGSVLDAPVCQNSGAFFLPPGQGLKEGGFDAVIGVPGCWGKLTPGTPYQVCTRLDWGDGETTYKCSPAFTVAELE